MAIRWKVAKKRIQILILSLLDVKPFNVFALFLYLALEAKRPFLCDLTM